MKLGLLILSIVVVLVTAILALAGSSWDSFTHLFALLCLALALFFSSFLPLRT
jgi:hypothetical protein